MKIERLLKKNFRIVVLASIAVAALLLTQAIALLVGVWFRVVETRAPVPTVPGAEAGGPVQTEEGGPTQVDADDPRRAPKCGLVKVLFIALSDLSGGVEQPLDPALARGIQKASEIDAARPLPASPGPTRTPSSDAGVRQLRISIDRSVIDKIAEGQGAHLSHGGHLVPEKENGRFVGVRLVGVRNGTLLGVLGMQNGDRLQTLDGFDMTERALEAYARLCTADMLTLRLNRGGQELDIVYDVE